MWYIICHNIVFFKPSMCLIFLHFLCDGEIVGQVCVSFRDWHRDMFLSAGDCFALRFGHWSWQPPWFPKQEGRVKDFSYLSWRNTLCWGSTCVSWQGILQYYTYAPFWSHSSRPEARVTRSPVGRRGILSWFQKFRDKLMDVGRRHGWWITLTALFSKIVWPPHQMISDEQCVKE